jgi:hypothetical protein
VFGVRPRHLAGRRPADPPAGHGVHQHRVAVVLEVVEQQPVVANRSGRPDPGHAPQLAAGRRVVRDHPGLIRRAEQRGALDDAAIGGLDRPLRGQVVPSVNRGVFPIRQRLHARVNGEQISLDEADRADPVGQLRRPDHRPVGVPEEGHPVVRADRDHLGRPVARFEDRPGLRAGDRAAPLAPAVVQADHGEAGQVAVVVVLAEQHPAAGRRALFAGRPPEFGAGDRVQRDRGPVEEQVDPGGVRLLPCDRGGVGAQQHHLAVADRFGEERTDLVQHAGPELVPVGQPVRGDLGAAVVPAADVGGGVGEAGRVVFEHLGRPGGVQERRGRAGRSTGRHQAEDGQHGQDGPGDAAPVQRPGRQLRLGRGELAQVDDGHLSAPP